MRNNGHGDNEGTRFNSGTIGAVLAAANSSAFDKMIGLRRELRRDEKRERKWRRRLSPTVARIKAAGAQMLAEEREKSARAQAAIAQRIAVFQVRAAAAIYGAHTQGQGLVEFALILFLLVVVFLVVVVVFGPTVSEILPTALRLPK